MNIQVTEFMHKKYLFLMAGLEVVCLYQIYAYIKYAYNESLL